MVSFPVTVEIPVLWGDMDALRHVNNARYFTWFESARIAYLGQLGGILPGAGPTLGLGEIGPIVASISCDFIRPIVYPATVRVGARVTEIGNSSLRMEYAVERSDEPDEVCGRGSSVVVIVRYATLEKVRVSDGLKAAIQALEKKANH